MSATTALVTEGITYGEGPRWHDGRLWFTDGPAGAVKAVNEVGEVGEVEVVAEMAHPSGLGWLPDGSMVVCTLREAKIVLFGPTGGCVVHDLGHHAWSTNDLVASPEGRIYVDLYLRSEAGLIGEIGLVTGDGSFRVVATDLATPNGLAITPDGRTLLAAETFASRITAFTIADNGDLLDRRVFADLGEARHPDGICLDAEGALWVACFDTGEFIRVRPGGEVTQCIRTAFGWAVAPALGGADRRTLFLVVNKTTHEDHARGVSSGRIECTRVDVPGAGWP